MGPRDLSYIDNIIAQLKNLVDPFLLVESEDTRFGRSAKQLTTYTWQGHGSSRKYCEGSEFTYRKRGDTSGALYVKREDKYYATKYPDSPLLPHYLNFVEGVTHLERIKERHSARLYPKETKKNVSSILETTTEKYKAINKSCPEASCRQAGRFFLLVLTS